MSDFEFDTEVVDISIGGNGMLLPPKNDLIALIDADTIAFAACVETEYMTEEDIGVGEVKFEEVWHSNIEEAYNHAMSKINTILDMTGCKDWELHFTSGRKSFRYTRVDPNYKANRLTGQRTPMGLMELKMQLVEQFPDKAFIWEEVEADDVVVFKKSKEPEKYLLCALDKDVLYSLPGRHFNYYSSARYNIDMKFYEVEELDALKHHYRQVLTGDAADGIIGLKGVGAKSADKILDGATTEKDMWDRVLRAYADKGRPEIDAIMNMRLVDTRQIKDIIDNKPILELWKPKE